MEIVVQGFADVRPYAVPCKFYDSGQTLPKLLLDPVDYLFLGSFVCLGIRRLVVMVSVVSALLYGAKYLRSERNSEIVLLQGVADEVAVIKLQVPA